MKATLIATVLSALVAGVHSLDKPLDIQVLEATECAEADKTKAGA